MGDLDRLNHLIRAGHPCISIVTYEEAEALDLVRRSAVDNGLDLLQWTVIDGLHDGLIAGESEVKDTENPAGALYSLSRLNERIMCVTLDLADHLGDDRTLRALRDLVGRFQRIGSHLVMIDHRSDMPAVVKSYATRFDLTLPDEEEIDSIIRQTVRRLHAQSPVQVKINKGQLRALVKNLRGLTRRQAELLVVEVVADDRTLDADDLNTVIARKRQLLSKSGLLEYVQTPMDMSAVGGLRRLKAWLKQRRGALTEEAKAYGLGAPRGVLMLGVQGAGKSLCAKAIATAWSRPLLRMDVGALYDRYVGESERRLRDALDQADAMAPIILWIDEIEKAFASAASQSTDGGLSKRMFGTLLTWMQEHESSVFLVATANDIEALPPELLRKGRFDEIFFVDLPPTEARRQIVRIHLKKRGRDPAGFDINAIVRASDGYSGAEIEQAIIAALHDAYSAKVELDSASIVKALKESPPLSVTMAERVAKLRRWARDRCVPAD